MELLATSDLPSIMKSLNESNAPKIVLTPGLEIDLIEKCLWTLYEKFSHHIKSKGLSSPVIEVYSRGTVRNSFLGDLLENPH